MSGRKIREFTHERIDKVENDWRMIAGEDEFEIELAGVFDWAKSHITKTDGRSQALELFNTETGTCDAIIEMVDSRMGKLTKLLKLVLSPDVWDIDKDRNKVVNIYIDAFKQSIANGVLKGAKEVKIYGRNDLMLSLLRSVHAHWQTVGTEAQFEGRFLTISTVG